MFSLVSLDAKNILPLGLMLFAGVGAYWLFVMARNRDTSAAVNADGGTTTTPSGMVSLATLQALFGGGKTTGASTTTTDSTSSSSGVSTSQATGIATYSAPTTSGSTSSGTVTQGV